MSSGAVTTKRKLRPHATASEQIQNLQRAKSGRKSTYTPEIAEFICTEISLGRSLSSICQTHDNVPHIATVMEWVKQHPSFGEDYARAREARADARADRIDAITDRLERGELDANAARVMIDALKWQAGKEQPKRYGDTMRVEANLSASVTIGALAAGRRRAQQTIEAEVIDVEPV